MLRWSNNVSIRSRASFAKISLEVRDLLFYACLPGMTSFQKKKLYGKGWDSQWFARDPNRIEDPDSAVHRWGRWHRSAAGMRTDGWHRLGTFGNQWNGVVAFFLRIFKDVPFRALHSWLS
jgi:hypothetical protein